MQLRPTEGVALLAGREGATVAVRQAGLVLVRGGAVTLRQVHLVLVLGRAGATIVDDHVGGEAADVRVI